MSAAYTVEFAVIIKLSLYIAYNITTSYVSRAFRHLLSGTY